MIMEDAKLTLQQLKDISDKFVQERDWGQYHSPKNLSMDISIEAAELMEKFLWLTTEESYEELEKNRQEISDELADVFFGILRFASVAKIDLASAFKHKLEQVGKKYPVEKAKGKREKYTKL